jgi:hypothetical protein
MNGEPRNGMDREKLKRQIKDAFAGVKLGNGIGLLQAQGLDNYADAATLARYRAEDEKEDWSKIPLERFNRCPNSLSYFDTEGMRFHLPAFLISSVDGTSNQDVVFTLTYFVPENMSRFDSLSQPQRKAVRDFLQYKLQDIDDAGREFIGPMIEKAIVEYWNRSTD